MAWTRRGLIGAGAAAAALPAAQLDAAKRNPFSADWSSLAAGYRAPDWFRDAKFGIWAHWGPQCVPEFGDWYARRMYQRGHKYYNHHLATYGHPADTGYLDLIGRWKAEHWDPDALIDRYVRAGARYFVAMANHHDNVDMYRSRHHGWNTTRVGPKKDIVGGWAAAARKRGLRFGVSNHSAHAWHWQQVAYGYDAEGPRTGARYDAFRLSKADGRGTWWEGLDPQDLYTGRNMVIPDGLTTIADANDWHAKNDRVWTEAPPPNNPLFVARWAARCCDLIDSYRPDLLYFDDAGLPLGQTGLDVAAHYYNAGLGWHGGRQEVVLNVKEVPPERRAAVVADVERGVRAEIDSQPWQTDSCIGDWHYDRKIFDEHRYKPAATVIHRLVDIVSKNGNLLLSVPVKPDGTIDSDERAILDDLTAWMAVNGESIYDTRPYRAFGEGPTQPVTGAFGEGRSKPYTAADIRYAVKGDTLYATVLGWPAGGIRMRELAGERVARVDLLGAGEVAFAQDENGITLTLPQAPAVPQPAHVFRLRRA
ncbi:MAG: alpha-L-fucosidase [Sphingomonas sp.]